jgi:hypothetical protein
VGLSSSDILNPFRIKREQKKIRRNEFSGFQQTKTEISSQVRAGAIEATAAPTWKLHFAVATFSSCFLFSFSSWLFLLFCRDEQEQQRDPLQEQLEQMPMEPKQLVPKQQEPNLLEP